MGALLRRRPLVVARRVAFPVGSRWKYGKARRYIAVSNSSKECSSRAESRRRGSSVVYDGVPLLPVSHGTQVLRLEKGRAPANLEKALEEAATVVYLTESEGLGSGALLAMSAGIPVIASDVGGLREIITHRENGILVRNDEAESRLLCTSCSGSRLRPANRRGRASYRHAAIYRGAHGAKYDRGLPAGDRVIEIALAILLGLLIGSFLTCAFIAGRAIGAWSSRAATASAAAS